MIYLIFVIGLILGSFYNVVGLRLPNNESIVFPGSHCPKCNHKLAWYENIPVLSYLFLGGKCKNCKKKIDIIYPLIELLTGILFATTYYLYGFSEEFLIGIILVSLVVIIFVSDTKYMIILDSPTIISVILIFIIKWIYEGIKVSLLSLLYGLFIFGIMYLLLIIGNFLFKKESLGGGDIKLSFVAGMVLGPYLGLFYIMFGSFLAFPYAIYTVIKNKNGVLPFGPFLASAMLILFYNIDLFDKFLKTLFNIKF